MRNRALQFMGWALCAMALMGTTALTSCNHDDENTPDEVITKEEIAAKVVGQWKVKSYNGEEYTTDKQTIYTFHQDGTFTVSASKPIRVQNYQHFWANKLQLPVTFTDGHIHVTGLDGNNLDIDVLELTDQDFVVQEQGEHAHTLTKILRAYTTDEIVGLWEGATLTGDETYGGVEARIEYRKDGSYVYYRHADGAWVQSENVGNEYNIDGDWLAMRWRPEAGADYNYEWWDIASITADEMRWTALRERSDKSRYTTEFTWRRVSPNVGD